MLNRVESTEYSRATTIVHTQENPITLLLVGIGQCSRRNARCLPITYNPSYITFKLVYTAIPVYTVMGVHVRLIQLSYNEEVD